MAKIDCSELSQVIHDLAQAIIEENTEVRELDDVVSEMKKIHPLINREQVADAIVEATRVERSELDRLQKTNNAVKREARSDVAMRREDYQPLVDSIEELDRYLEDGTLPEPKETGKLSTFSLDQLRATRNNMAKWLRTSDPAMRKKMQAQIDKIDHMLATGDIEVTKKRETQLHESLNDINEKLQEAKGKLASARETKVLEEQVDVLVRHLEEGTIPRSRQTRVREPGPNDILKEIRDSLRKKLRNSPPAQKERIKKQIQELNDVLRTGVPVPKPKVTAEIPEDKELFRLMYERDRARQEVRLAVYNLKPKSIWSHIIEPFNALRAIKTSFDFSAVFRQGGFIALGHPVRAAKAIPDMLRAFSSEQKSAEINAKILNSENAPYYSKSGLFLGKIDSSQALSQMEEAYMSRWAEKIPGVRASERAYVTFLNKLRADSFDTMAAALTKNGQPTLNQAKAISRYINVATGRGVGIESAAAGLNTAFFAPRFVASRFQLMVFQPIWGGKRGEYEGTLAIREAIAWEYARYFIGLTTVAALGSAAGGDWELVRRSSDFGNLRWGNTRIDLMSGLSQTIVLASRLQSGAMKSSATGKIKPIKGDKVPYGSSDTDAIIARFLRTKLSPTFGVPYDFYKGENVVGEKATFDTLIGKEEGVSALNIVTPLALADIYDAMKDQGVPAGTALGIVSVFGMGLQTYKPYKSKKRVKKFKPRGG